MRYRGLMIFVLGVLLMVPRLLYGHGAMGKVDAGGIAVTAQYDTGEAMSYAKVKISAPGTELAFQSGRTDRNGRFCFFPDAKGDWKVVVDDEMGHRLEVVVPVDEDLALRATQPLGEARQSSLSRYQKALVGISTLFGISGILFWWIGRKNKES